MPNVMAARPNIGGVLCSTPQVWLTPTIIVLCSNAAKTRNALKFALVPQNSGTDLSRQWAEVHHIMRTCAGNIAV